MTIDSIPSPSQYSDTTVIAENEKWLLDKAAKIFIDRGKWPEYRKLHREAAGTGIDIPGRPAVMPSPDWLWRIDAPDSVVLSLKGLWRSTDGVDIAGKFLQIVILSYKIYLSEPTTEDALTKITSTDLKSQLGFDDTSIDRIHKILLNSEQFITHGGSVTSDTEWQYTIHESIVKFKNISTLDDYFDKRAEIFKHFSPRPPLPELIARDKRNNYVQPIPPDQDIDPSNVFLVYGRNKTAKDALSDFLKRLNLHPMEWEEMVKLTGITSPYIKEVLDKGFSQAQAIVVLLTPDDEARLKSDLADSSDGSEETQFTGQPRPNVIFEAGMAFGIHPYRTILVEFGKIRPISDLLGVHTIRFNGSSSEPLKSLAVRLKNAGCAVQESANSFNIDILEKITSLDIK